MSGPLDPWICSGAASLTGRAAGPPLGPPGGLGSLLDRLACGSPLDPWQLLVERAAGRGLTRAGDVSCGGATRLLRAADGWIAVSLAREADRELVPAWLEVDHSPDSAAWPVVGAAVAGRRVDELEDRAALLGLAVGVPGASTPVAPRAPAPFDGLPVNARGFGPAGPRATPSTRAPRSGRPPVVVDLSSLWAGPLCTRLLRLDGFRVIKVESTGRPDAARSGDPEMFDLLHEGKESVAVDLASREGVAALRRLVAAADIIVEASRPRALEQLGIDAAALLDGAAGPQVWISITGHGRAGEASRRVAFGDDAAVAGGLVSFDGTGPCFCVDAIADPLAGMVAAATVGPAWRSGRRWLVDVAMAAVAAAAAGPTVAMPDGVDAPPPRPSTASGPAAPLGTHTGAVLAELTQPGVTVTTRDQP